MNSYFDLSLTRLSTNHADLCAREYVSALPTCITRPHRKEILNEIYYHIVKNRIRASCYWSQAAMPLLSETQEYIRLSLFSDQKVILYGNDREYQQRSESRKRVFAPYEVSLIWHQDMMPLVLVPRRPLPFSSVIILHLLPRHIINEISESTFYVTFTYVVVLLGSGSKVAGLSFSTLSLFLHSRTVRDRWFLLLPVLFCVVSKYRQHEVNTFMK